MKTLCVLAAWALLSSASPSFSQISAGVGHQLKEKAPDGADASRANEPADPRSGLSEGRAAAPAVGDKLNGAADSGDERQTR